MKNRSRTINKSLFFSTEEWNHIQAKMDEAEITNFSVYCRRMLLNGEVKHYDFSVFREISINLGRIAGNINQIAKRCNENRTPTLNDVNQLRREYQNLKALYQQQLIKALRKL